MNKWTKIATIIVGIGVIAGGAFAYVDSRIDAKLAPVATTEATHETRLSRIEDKLDKVLEGLAELRGAKEDRKR